MSTPKQADQPVITPNVGVPSVATRKWIYGVAFALLAIAVFYRLIPQEAAPFWLDLITNVLGLGGTGLALANAPRR